MSCDDVLEGGGAVVLTEYKNLAHDSGLQVGVGSDGEVVSDPAGAEGGEGPDNDDDKDEPAETSVCAFLANNLHKGRHRGS